MKKIAIFGTHGAAKTTLVYRLASYFKMLDKNVKVIHETARQSPFPINQDVVYQTTVFVITTQIKKELEAEAEGFEIVISDRTPSDAFIYLNHLQRDNSLTHSLEVFCMEWVKRYDLLIYLEPTEGFIPTADGKRATDVSYQQAIRDDFRLMLEELNLNTDKKLIKAESSQVFDDEESKNLMNLINRSLYEQHRQTNLA